MGRRLTDNVDDVASCAFAVGSANSFTGGTRVRMADGTTKRIDDVEVGDLVLATDPTTGRGGPRAVTAVIEGTGLKDLVEIGIDGAEIVATQGHPVWSATRGHWVGAGDLAPGDRLGAAPVTGTREWAEHHTVYNLTVDELHTYFVVAGDSDLLVHNEDPCNRAGAGMPKKSVEEVTAKKSVTAARVQALVAVAKGAPPAVGQVTPTLGGIDSIILGTAAVVDVGVRLGVKAARGTAKGVVAGAKKVRNLFGRDTPRELPPGS